MNNRSFYSTFFLLVAFHIAILVPAQTKQYAAPARTDSASWCMILLPDPQTYVKFGRNQPVFELMTAWIADNIERLNIRLVLCTGDLVEQNDMINPDGVRADQPSKAQWESVARAFSRLDGKVPYINAAGNHDYGYVNVVENRRTHYDQYFPVDKNLLTRQMVREVALNAQDDPTLENAAFEFISPQGRKFLVLNLEFAPRDTIIQWARQTAALPKYKDHTIIVLTHSYLDAQNQHIQKENYPVKDANYGAAIWQKLIAPSSNIQLVFAGHIGAPDNPKAHVAFRTDQNAANKKVNQMVFNAQALGGGWHGNGGDGWLRILEFMPDRVTVKVSTFSPLFAISPSTQSLAWRTQLYDAFTFRIDQ